MLVWLGHNRCQHLGQLPSPTQSPDLIFPQVSVQLQGLLQGLGHHLLPPAQEVSFLHTQIKAQTYSQLLRAGAV